MIPGELVKLENMLLEVDLRGDEALVKPLSDVATGLDEPEVTEDVDEVEDLGETEGAG